MLSDPEMYSTFILDKLNAGWSPKQIKLLGAGDRSGFEAALEELIDDENWDEDLSFNEWSSYVDDYCKQNPIPIEIESATVGETRNDIASSIGSINDPDSSWKALKSKLLQSGISVKSINDIEASSRAVLQRLSPDTRDTKPIKGLVFGSVQSGKTANMEALVSMAADTHWNVFIILTGTIESLRVQTRDRFASDLCTTQSINWEHLDLSKNSKDITSSMLSLNTLNDHKWGNRYVITCLKQKSRLSSLIEWLYNEPDKTRRMRIIVIDDEADQASINTAEILDAEDADEYEQDRKEINRLIVCLANGLLPDGTEPTSRFQAMNYISYTATPYANVLNEKPGESLYPKDFVHSLAAPNEYFGVNVIFGNREYVDDNGNSLAPGLDIIRTVPQADISALKTLHANRACETPESLRDALCWFLCCAGVLRSRGHKKPISMLIHTSNRTVHHEVDYQIVNDYLTQTPLDAVLQSCRTIYEEETKRFWFDDLESNFSTYGLLDKVDREIPPFETFANEIALMLQRIGNIMLADKNATAYTYSEGINICIDNCFAERNAPEDVVMRAIYPSKTDLEKMQKAPVFIVMGGNTLARGLTIEGLVCSYFTRDTNQADTLMQMGRWFGYRKGYELLQRIWMTDKIRAKFNALSIVEMKLKSEIKQFEDQGLKPSQLGVKVCAMPELAKFTLSAKNKMQSASSCDYDFTGYTYEITEFDGGRETLQSNLDASLKFLKDTTAAVGMPKRLKNAAVWTHVETRAVIDYLSSFKLSTHSNTTPDDVKLFTSWLKEADGDRIDYWDVAVAGKTSSPSGTWSAGEVDGLPRVERSRKAGDDDRIDIGSMRSGADALCDIDADELNADQRMALNAGGINKNVVAKRAHVGMERVPLLLIYRIDRNSSASGKYREAIGTELDIMSFSVIIPGDKHAGGKVSAVRINME